MGGTEHREELRQIREDLALLIEARRADGAPRWTYEVQTLYDQLCDRELALLSGMRDGTGDADHISGSMPSGDTSRA